MRTTAASHRSDESCSPLTVLMKFRMIVNSAKRHYRWIEQECGVNGAHLWALWEISRANGMRVSELGTALAMHQSTASNLIEKLVRSGLITRSRSPEDRRVVTLALTKKGSALLKRAPRPARGILPEALHRLPHKTLVQLDRSLLALLEHMKAGDKSGKSTPLALLLGKD
ncbi:MAG: MarR family winged helix-turn-helix transcriptional regulator [Methanocella sp.]